MEGNIMREVHGEVLTIYFFDMTANQVTHTLLIRFLTYIVTCKYICMIVCLMIQDIYRKLLRA